MRWLPYKSKQLFLLLLKVALLSAVCFFIYHKLTANQELSWINFRDQLQSISWKAFIVLFIFTVLNWSLEIFKWKKLTQKISAISFQQSAFQLLSAHAVAILTPNRIGEYGAKPMFFLKKYWKKIVLYNFFGNMSQLLATVIFGMIGIAFLLNNSAFQLNFISFQQLLVSTGTILIVLFFLRKSVWFQQQFSKLKKAFHQFSAIQQIEILGLSIGRYLIFSHQFYFLLVLLNVDISYLDAMSCIFSMYFLASILPSVFLLDAVVKGGIAVWLFSFFQVEALPVLAISLTMWLLNFALPGVIGSLLWFKFQPRFDLKFSTLWK